jgi:hypothetical protein
VGEHPIQKPTVFLLNAALLACIALLVFLLGTSLVHSSPLALHFAVLLVFAVGLLASVNWCALTSIVLSHILAIVQLAKAAGCTTVRCTRCRYRVAVIIAACTCSANAGCRRLSCVS